MDKVFTYFIREIRWEQWNSEENFRDLFIFDNLNASNILQVKT